MADLITITQLSALVEDQYRLLSWLEDHGERLPAYDTVFPERNEVALELAGDPWSLTVTRSGYECCHRGSGRIVVLAKDHPSPFDFHPETLLRFLHSTDATNRITDIVVDNWILKFVRAGRLSSSRHRSGYYTFGG